VYSLAGIHKIFLDDEGRAKEEHVVLGEQGKDWVEILSPELAANQQVITSGQRMLSDGVIYAKKCVAELNLPPDYGIVFGGQADMLNETAYYFAVALILSITFMYLILAAQFESWIYPISILAALPVTIPFGLLSLLLLRTPLDLYAMFGLFMLIGIVKKNGILQIDKTNELRRGGTKRDAAILEANFTRLRPILMTTVMLMAAMIPIAMGQGPGASARASMAKVIIGGQALSLLLSLVLTPVVYSLLDDSKILLKKRFRGMTDFLIPASEHH